MHNALIMSLTSSNSLHTFSMQLCLTALLPIVATGKVHKYRYHRPIIVDNHDPLTKSCANLQTLMPLREYQHAQRQNGNGHDHKNKMMINNTC